MYTSRYLDEDFFKYFLLVNSLKNVGLRHFIFEVTHEKYPKLVRILYANLTYANGVIIYEVKKCLIALSHEEST